MPAKRATAATQKTPLAELPARVTADALGGLLGISGRRVRELAREGRFPRGTGGRYALAECVQAYVVSIREAARTSKPAPDPALVEAVLDGRKERARLAKAQADRAELDLAERRGELVDAAAMRNWFVGLIGQARNQLLAVPSRARGRLTHLTVDEIEHLEDLITEALEALAEGRGDDDHDAGDDSEDEDYDNGAP